MTFQDPIGEIIDRTKYSEETWALVTQSSIPQNKSPPISGPQTSNPTVSKRCPFCEYESVIAHNVKRHIRFKHTNEKPFKCTVCVKSFATKSNLQVHMRIHTGERPYQCPLCSKAFTQLGSRSMHMRMVHSMPYEETGDDVGGSAQNVFSYSMETLGRKDGHACPYCNYKSITPHNIQKHIRYKHTGERPFPCSFCSKSKLKKEIMFPQLRQCGEVSLPLSKVPHSRPSSNEPCSQTKLSAFGHQCPYCNYRSSTQHNIQKHIRYRHTGERPFPCSLCESSYNSSNVKRHIRFRHTGEKPYQCSVCSKVFAESTGLNVHMRIHTGDRPFSCKICLKTFAQAINLKKHMGSNHPSENFLDIRKKNLSSVRLAKSLSLLNSIFKFTSGVILRRSFISVTFVIRVSQMYEPSLYHNRPYTSTSDERCEFGSDVMMSSSYQDTKIHVCIYCDYKSNKISYLKKHMMFRHTQEKPFSCDVCHKKFGSKQNLQVHTRIHTGEKPFKCSICFKEFNHISNLKIQEPRTYPSFEGEVETSPDRPDEYGGPIVLNDPVQSSRLYQCPHCEYKSNVLINVKQHIKFKHTGERPFACLICFKRFTTKQNLQVHTRIHTGEKPYRCSVCLKDFNHKSNYDKHKKYIFDLMTREESDAGSKIYSSKSEVFFESVGKGLKTHFCSYCDYKSNNGNNVRRHVMRHHTNVRPYHCTICPKTFSIEPNLQLHMRTHTGEKPYHCTVCLKYFSQKSNLNKHKKTCVANTCVIKYFEQSWNPTSSHGNCIPQNIMFESDPKSDSSKAYHCPYCDYRSVLVQNVKRHVDCKHSGARPFQCTICSKRFSIKANLRLHMRTHTEIKKLTNFYYPQIYGVYPFGPSEMTSIPAVPSSSAEAFSYPLPTENIAQKRQCPYCNYSSYKTNDVKRHIMCKHSTEKPFQCTFCPKSFSIKPFLSVHMRTHTGEKPYKCPSCFKCFSVKSTLNSHRKICKTASLEMMLKDILMSRHSSEKPFICSLCPKRFSIKPNLVLHMRTHTGEKPYKCTHCSKCFSVKCNLNVHKKSNSMLYLLQVYEMYSNQDHLEAAENQWASSTSENLQKESRCPFCYQVFYHSSSLKRHINCKHSTARPFHCHLCPKRFAIRNRLSLHLRTHTGEKPYKCTYCSKCFSAKCNLNVHESRCKAKSILDTNGGNSTVYEMYSNQDHLEAAENQWASSTSENLQKESRCPFCYQLFYHSSSLKRHINCKHSTARPFHCHLCPKRFAIRNRLSLHLRTHTGEKPYKCSNCLKCFSQKGSLNSHKVICRPRYHSTHSNPSQTSDRPIYDMYSYEDSRMLGIPESLTSDLTSYPTSREYSSKKRQCPYCDYSSNVGNDVKRHIMCKHSNEKRFQCTFCQKKFSIKPHLVVHMRIHTGEKPYKCSVCFKTFCQKSALNRHKIKCISIFETYFCQDSEMSLTQNAPTNNSDTSTNLSHDYGLKKRQCPYCDYNSFVANNVKRHIMCKHSSEKPFQCTFCPKKFPIKEHLVIHTRIHTGEKPYKCSKCFKCFSQKSSLNSHNMRCQLLLKNQIQETLRKNPKEENYPNPRLQIHLLLALISGLIPRGSNSIVDNDEKESKSRLIKFDKRELGPRPIKTQLSLDSSFPNCFFCPYCNYESFKNSNVKRHIIFKHTGEKYIQCPVCSKWFTTKDELKVHTRVHTGEKPFQCPFCPMKFSQSSNLGQHVKRKHEK
ncbi:Zinc finger protein Xfin [Armadillidium vulgare]|nr:Zinc finger protein Xfin [Armadillidium vulgare]